MKVAVLGAAGRTGRLVIAEATARGHEVKALVRSRAQLASEERCSVVEGDARDAAAVRRVIEGCDAVVSALGPTSGPPDVCSTATKNVLVAMRELGVRRYIVISGAGLDFPGDRKDLPGRIVSKIIRLLSPAIVADKDRELALLQASDVEWILARPPRLVDGPARGFRVSHDRALASKVRRADLAAFLVSQLESRENVRRAPFVTA